MDQRLIISVTAAVSAAAGAFIGFKVAVQQLDAKYNELMETEIQRTRDFYARVNKADEFGTPESAAESLGVAEAADALLKYRGQGGVDVQAVMEGKDEDMRVVETTAVIHQNVFSQDRSKPYIISEDEFGLNETEYNQLSVTYYAGDDTVADEQDQPIPEHSVTTCIGSNNLAFFGPHNPDPNVIHVRNDQLQIDYEIRRSEGLFAHEVMGFKHSDETFEPMRRRRGADE